jgi:hypothetical protein
MKVKSMRGRVFDMSQLVANNQKAVALGNASMNARGDIVNRKGDIVKPRAQVIPQYNSDNPKAVKQVALRDIPSEVFITPAEAAAAFKKPENTQATPEANPTTTRKRVIKD